MRTTIFRGLLLSLVAGALFMAPAPGAAQSREVTVEASLLGGAVGYAHPVAGSTLLGFEVGAALPQIALTLHPGSDSAAGAVDLQEYLHLAVFFRLPLSERTDVDAGLRGGVADLYECTASDCWPASFVGAYVQPMWGGDRFKVGARVLGALVGESPEGGPESSTFALGISPLVVRLTVPW